ncbi:MAG: hypothetical protein JW919_00840 [Candidatus Omnitrophica bacterium]|nr:hypothetical protein [Candidatus Omnitrophota bacterium]
MDTKKKTLALVFVLAVFAGLIYIYPDLRFVQEAGNRYKGIVPIGFRDETVYLGRINAIYRGDFLARNPAIYEHRNDPVIMPTICESIEALIGKALVLSVAQLDMLWTFLMPALIFILVFVFSYEISGVKWCSIAMAAGVLFGMHLASKIFIFGGKLINTGYHLPLWFARPITPQMHFVFFTLALIFLYKALNDGRKTFVWLAGIFLGSLFYVSVFYWMHIYATIGVLCIVFLAQKDLSAFRKAFAIAVIGAIVSVPYWMMNIQTMRDPNYGLLLLRFNVAYTHKPVLPVATVAALAFLLLARRAIVAVSGKRTFQFLAAMLAAVILLVNQQVLTGRLFKESHWTAYTGKFVLIITVILSVAALAKVLAARRTRLAWLQVALPALFFSALLVHGIGMQLNYHRHHFNDNLKLQQMAGAFRWLNANALPGDVILPSPNDIRLSELIPIYTKSYVYYSEPFFCLSLISAGETRYRMLAAYRLFGLTLDEAVSHPYSWDGAIFLTGDSNRTREFMETERKALVSRYKMMLSEDGLRLAKKYKVDYVVAVKGRDDDVIKDLLGAGFKTAYEDRYFSVIKVGG